VTADELIDTLNLQPHPEGGWYKQTWVDDEAGSDRPTGTCIYFMLKAGERSHWHRVDATEIWHYYAGGALVLHVAASAEGPASHQRLGPAIETGARPQVIVPKNAWQSAELSLGSDWGLVGCTVSPGFQFDGFELAPPGFDIPSD